MPNAKWILVNNDDDHHNSRVASSRTFDDPREVASLWVESGGSFDIWKAREDRNGKTVPDRKVVAAFPVQSPDEWYPHKYTPAPDEYLFVQNNLPVGELDALTLFDKGPDKASPLLRNEIEFALVESDLASRDVQKAMDMLPNVKSIYGFLEQKGQFKTINLIRRLLTS